MTLAPGDGTLPADETDLHTRRYIEGVALGLLADMLFQQECERLGLAVAEALADDLCLVATTKAVRDARH